MSLVHNERTKLTAAWLNTLSGAATAAGAIAPLAATFYSIAAAPVSPDVLSLGVAIWFLPASAYIWLQDRFAARPSGTEDIYKIYAESFRSEDHLRQIQKEAQN